MRRPALQNKRVGVLQMAFRDFREPALSPQINTGILANSKYENSCISGSLNFQFQQRPFTSFFSVSSTRQTSID